MRIGEIEMHTQLMNIKQVVLQTGRCRSAIYADIQKGDFPPPVKVGPRASRWRSTDIEAWIEGLPTAELNNATINK